MLLQEEPGQPVASPFVLHFLQTVDDVVFDAEGVLHESGGRLLVAQDPVFQLLHEAHGGVGRHGQGLAVSGHGSDAPAETAPLLGLPLGAKVMFKASRKVMFKAFSEKKMHTVYPYKLNES